MKTRLAVLKLGARITAGGSSGGSGEVVKICEMLAKGDAEVNVYTKILPKDELTPEFKWHQILDEYEDINNQNYDALVVVNGNINWFGGSPSDEQTINYLIMNKFKGPVFYILCDPALMLTQIWKSVSAKNEVWKEKFNARTWSEDEILITRKDIHYICQSNNVEHIAECIKKTNIECSSITTYPFSQFPLLNPRPSLLSDPIIDLSYGGTLRGGKREKKLIDFYWGYPEDISVEVFGKIKHDQFNPKKIANLSPPRFTGAVSYDKMLNKMSEAMVHVVIGDDAYSKFDMQAQRIYEAVLAGCVPLIDSSLDINKRVYGSNKDLSEFLYVKNRDEVIDRIRTIKSMGDGASREIVNDILKHFNFKPDEYCQGFVNLIKSKL